MPVKLIENLNNINYTENFELKGDKKEIKEINVNSEILIASQHYDYFENTIQEQIHNQMFKHKKKLMKAYVKEVN